MQLKEIKDNTRRKVGYGAGSGDIISRVYKCPCGIGKIYYEKDDIPGLKK